MPIHDWTRVEAGIFHSHHGCWITEIQATLNDGLLPVGFYALSEQHAGRAITDVLTLHASPEATEPPQFHPPLPFPATGGGTAVAEAPPKVRRRRTFEPTAVRQRTLAIRHVSGHRLVAILEIVSPANKDRAESVSGFAEKILSALDHGVHVLLVDLFPPGPFDSQGMHGAIQQRLGNSDEPYDLPADEPLTLASYAWGAPIDIYLEHAAVGALLPQMPLFLHHDRYVNVPLEETYQAAYRGMPAFWKQVLEGTGGQGDRSS